jgi:hypothetical protein
MGGANGSRECAPDDELRDTHRVNPRQVPRWVSQALNPSYGLNNIVQILTLYLISTALG